MPNPPKRDRRAAREGRTLDYAPAGKTRPDPFHPASRRNAIAAGAVLFIAIVLAYAGPSWAVVLYELLTDGLLLLVWLVAAAGLGAFLLLPLRLGATTDDLVPPHRPLLLFLVTATGLGLGVLSLATLALGLTGLLTRATAVGLLGLGLLPGAVLIVRNRTGPDPSPFGE